MNEQVREPVVGQARESYATPDLVVHGSVDVLTKGTFGSVPDNLSPGSTLPPP